MHALFYDGIVPSFDFLKKLQADYIVVLKDDPVFSKELSSDYLRLVHKDDNTKIYKLVTSL